MSESGVFQAEKNAFKVHQPDGEINVSYKGQKITIHLTHGSERSDTYIDAVYNEDGKELSLLDAHYEELLDVFADEIIADWESYQISRAESYYEDLFERHWGGYSSCHCSKCDGNPGDHI